MLNISVDILAWLKSPKKIQEQELCTTSMTRIDTGQHMWERKLLYTKLKGTQTNPKMHSLHC